MFIASRKLVMAFSCLGAVCQYYVSIICFTMAAVIYGVLIALSLSEVE